MASGPGSERRSGAPVALITESPLNKHASYSLRAWGRRGEPYLREGGTWTGGLFVPTAPPDRYTPLDPVGDGVRFYEPWWPRRSFLFSSFTILFFPLLCPEVSGVVAVCVALRWAASPPAHEPPPLPADFSVWTEGGGEGGPLSPSSCPALFGLHGKAPKLLPEV